MQPHMKLDTYGRTIIRNIYFDTDTFRLIRRSLEKPVYKEKLRIRSYKPVETTDPVFVEIKKKYKSVVYKRRLQLTEGKVMESFQTGEPLPVHSQIGDEIQYFRDYYENLHPSVFLSYEREAYLKLPEGFPSGWAKYLQNFIYIKHLFQNTVLLISVCWRSLYREDTVLSQQNSRMYRTPLSAFWYFDTNSWLRGLWNIGNIWYN